jgi:hypothetical protein
MPKTKKLLGIRSIKWECNTKIDLTEIELGVCTGFVWRMVETSGGFFYKRGKNVNFHKMIGISRVVQAYSAP